MEKALPRHGSSRERLESAIRAYFKLVDDMQDEMLVMYQETKSLEKEALKYVLKKELDFMAIFEPLIRDCVQEDVFQLSDAEIKAYAHNILVMGQMWAFRRWVLGKQFTIDEYIDLQIKFIFR